MNMTFILPNGKRVTLSKRKVDSIVTTRLSPIFYWQHMKMLTKQEILDFFDRKADFKTVKKICWYILFHAENLVLSGYLWKRGIDGKDEAEKYLEFNRPLLEGLRELYKQVNESNAYEIADKMLDLCLDYGVDPF